MNGTPSLANRDFGRVARAIGPKVVFSGAATMRMNAQARAISLIRAENPQTKGLAGG